MAFVIRGPGAAPAQAAEYHLVPQPKCNVSDVLPTKTIVLAALLLYISISTNYLTLSQGVAKFIFSHPYVRIIIVFVLAFFVVDYNGPFRLLSRVASAALITLIYQIVVGLTEVPDCSAVSKTLCPACVNPTAPSDP